MSKGRSEKAILNDSLVALSAERDACVWRNNTGMAWQGEEERHRPGARIVVTKDMVILRNGRRVRFGIPGSSDIIGTIRGLPLAAEIKREIGGAQSDQQVLFQRAWEKAGGFYVLARSPEELLHAIHVKLDLTEFGL